MIFVWILLIPGILYSDIFAQRNAFSVSSGLSEESLGYYIGIFEDADGSLSIDEITSPQNSSRFIPADQKEPGFGFSSSAYWIRFTVKNESAVPAPWLLEIAYPPLDYISLYIPVNGSYFVKKTGDHLPFSSREVKHRNFVFNMTEEPQSTRTYYVRVASTSSVNFPAKFWKQEAFIQNLDREQLLQGIYFGAVLIMIIYNIFLYLGFREKSFIYLLLFITAWGFAQLSINGLASQYLWPDWIWWGNINIPFFIFATLAASTQFCRSLLNTKNNIPVWDKILRGELLVFIAGMVISLTADYSFSVRISAALAIMTIISLGVAGAISVSYGRSGLFFLSAWGLFFLGGLLFALKSFGILPGNLITNWGVQTGSFALIVLLSIAVQDRIDTEKKEKSAAQQEAIRTQQQMVLALKESERFLERRVEERTQEINNINILLIERATELANINRIAEKASSTLLLQDVLQYICEELVKIFDVQSAGIALLNDSKSSLKIAAFHSADSEEENITGTELLLSDYEASSMVMETRQPLIVKHAQNDKRTKSIHDFLKRNNADSILIVPILSKNQAVGTIGMPFISEDNEIDKNKIELARSIAFHIASSVENARLYDKTEKALDVAERDLEIGRQIQSGFFPESLPEVPGWEFAAHFKPARQVSGDFYDIFTINNSNLVVLVIADVCDKGVGAALFMVLVRTLIRSLSEMKLNKHYTAAEPAQIISAINNYLTKTHGSSNMFASIFYAVLDTEKNILSYVNAGHEAPVLLNSEGHVSASLLPTGPVAGMLPDMNFEVRKIDMNDTDILFAFTDGTSDAKNTHNEFFSEDKIIKSVTGRWSSAYSMLYELNSEIKKFTGDRSQYDDITQIAVKKKALTQPEIHSICRPAEKSFLWELRDFVESAAVYKKIPGTYVHDLRLAAEEICTNIISYGFRDQSPGVIRIFFEVENDRAVLKIQDTGSYFSPLESKDPDTDAEWYNREQGGLGLFLVKKLFDDIKYSRTDDNHNCLTLIKKLNIQEKNA